MSKGFFERKKRKKKKEAFFVFALQANFRQPPRSSPRRLSHASLVQLRQDRDPLANTLVPRTFLRSQQDRVPLTRPRAGGRSLPWRKACIMLDVRSDPCHSLCGCPTSLWSMTCRFFCESKRVPKNRDFWPPFTMLGCNEYECEIGETAVHNRRPPHVVSKLHDVESLLQSRPRPTPLPDGLAHRVMSRIALGL